MSIRFAFLRNWSPVALALTVLALILAAPLLAQPAPGKGSSDANRPAGTASRPPLPVPDPKLRARAGPGFQHPDDFKPPPPAPEGPGVRAYASDIHESFDMDLGAPAITIVAARNGVFNGKVDVASGGPIKGLKATISDLKGPGGTVPAAAIQVRYAASWDPNNTGYIPSGREVLLEAPPAEVPLAKGRALMPVWITVSVPKDAKSGDYTGQLAIQADGKALPPVPVKLTVRDWTVPEVQSWRTWIEMVESPDTLAVEYNLPLWSDKHFDLIARSFRLISGSGSRMVYVPLVAHTNLGNEESMVRWVKKGAKYEPDYTVVDKYLDAVAKNLGTPKIVCFWAWDTWGVPRDEKFTVVKDDDSSSTKVEKAKLAARADLGAKGVPVTILDPATGKGEMGFLPRYYTPEGKALWAPVWKTLREKMKARGWEQTMMIGCLTDWLATKEDTAALKELTGDLPWVSCSHHCSWLHRPEGGKNVLNGIASVGFTTLALSFELTINPQWGRTYGWRGSFTHPQFWRGNFLTVHTLSTLRHEAECQITGSQSGLGRLGGDFWYCVRDKRGRRAGIVTDRWPESYWHNLNILNSFLAPGPEGALATTRFEIVREGVQECEARIAIESVLTDAAAKAKLGDALAKKAQAFLDDQQRNLWRAKGATEDYFAYGHVDYSTYDYDIQTQWKENAGNVWFVKSGWADRVGQLYDLAAEVSGKVAGK